MDRGDNHPPHVDDDEQTIKEVLAEINAENNRHIPPPPDAVAATGPPPAAPPPPPQTQPILPPAMPHPQQVQTPPHPIAYPPPPPQAPTYYQAEAIGSIVSSITKHAKTFAIIAILVILLRSGVVEQYVVRHIVPRIPIPYVHVLVDIAVSFAVYMLLSHQL